MGAARSFGWLVIAVVCATALADENTSSDAQDLRTAAQVFAGTVQSIHREGGAVVITVHVDDAIKGTTSGTDFQWREWEGLWRSSPRYRIGDRFVIFLRPPASTGLTSPLKMLKVQADRVQLQRRSQRLGGRQSAVPYSDYMRALHAVQ
jgi:hypothetical protein